jgi:hypothetical protein
METNILLSKIVANPTDTTWSQAYSTLNLYVVLSIDSENPKASIVTEGKELLERIQREYFSIEEKSLKNIKTGVENAIQDIPKGSNPSLVLATINDNFVYIVISGGGSAILKRGGKIGVVAKGEPGDTSAFSGKLEPDDVLILETQEFSDRIPTDKLSGIMDDLGVSEISENLAPLIHEEAKGTEAAVILQYKPVEKIGGEDSGDERQEDIQAQGNEQSTGGFSLPDNIKVPSFINLASFTSLGRRKIIIIAIVILVVILSASILFERSRQESLKRAELLAEILEPAQNRLDEAEALISLNKGLALEEFESIKKTLDENRNKFAENTPERRKLDEFIGKVEDNIGEIGAGSTVSSQKVIFEDADFVQFKEGSLIASDKNGLINLLSSSGETEKEIDAKNENTKAIAANETSIFIVGDSGITRTVKSSGTTNTIVDNPGTTIAIDTFGSNLYGLDTQENTVDKYQGSNFTRADYFTEDVSLDSPSSMTIDGSVWIIDNGRVRKFTRGKEDSFTVTGLSGKISSNALIFTSVDYENIYVLDKNSAKIISISKTGELSNQYLWTELSKATSFAVDEEGKKIFAVIGGKLYSFDL